MPQKTTKKVTPTQAPEIEPDPHQIDNWGDRQFMVCDTCMFYRQKVGTIGRCRRNAPTLEGWPVVYYSDWCGNHKLDAEKMQ